MRRAYYSRLAEQDLDEILDYLSRDRPLSAERVLARIKSKCQRLAERPGLGQRRPDLAAGDCYVSRANSFVIVYRVVDDDIEIVRVIHGARNWERLV